MGTDTGSAGNRSDPESAEAEPKNSGPPQINKCMINSGRPTSRFAVKGLQKAECCLCLSNLL